jgi:hypothetical protein
MKKITLVCALVVMAFSAFSQATFIVTTPTNNGTSSFRLPNGTSAAAYFNGATLVRSTELTMIPMSTTISSIGFTTTTGASSANTGTINIYLQNSGDMTFNKGTTWSGVTPGMTLVYTGTMTVPTSASVVDLPLTTPFVYLGNSVYVAYEWISTGGYATSGAIWASNTALTNGCISGTSASAPPTTCVTSSFRPCVRFGYANSVTNDISVEVVYGLGSVPIFMTGPFTYEAIVRNNSVGALTNVPVSLNISGANTFAATQTVASIAAGATATVSFNSWSPLAQGAQTVNVSIPSDQNNANNSKDFLATVTCSVGGYNENPKPFTTSVGFNTGSGIIATQVQLATQETITAVYLAISSNSASVGNNIYGAIVDNTGMIIGTTNTLNITSGDLNTKPAFTFTAPVVVTAGQIWHIGMAQTQNSVTGYYPVAAYSVPMITPNIMYSTTALTGGTLTPLTTNLGVFGFEPVFMATCGPMGVTSISPVDGLMIYPNPANTAVNVKLNSVSGKATVSVYNALGQLVIAEKEVNGDSAEINVSTLTKGVYIVKVTNGKEVSNTKIVVEH